MSVQHRAAQREEPGSRKDVLLLPSAWDNFSIRLINHLKCNTVLEQLNCFRLQMKWFGVNWSSLHVMNLVQTLTFNKERWID